MGSIHTSVNDFLETIIDIVGIKAGIILTKQEVVDILKAESDYYDFGPEQYNRGLRLRSEEYEEQIRLVRIGIGNLKPGPPAMFSDGLIPFFERGEDVHGVLQAFTAITGNYRDQKVDPDLLIDRIVNAVPHASLELIIAVIKWFIRVQEESYHISPPERADWDGGTPLKDLFNCEIKSGNDYFDQKFLDYLAVNDDKIKVMHWRNFERFCAEFFRRHGYEIELGPGTNDGGVDIRAFDPLDRENTLVLIQCKRYSEGRKVSIEAVKSFYTDVDFDGAVRGMIITSGQIAEGGKKVVSARKYPLTFAEQQEVKQWAKAMWRHS